MSFDPAVVKQVAAPPTQSFVVGVLRPAMRVEHVVWVVGSEFVYLAELNELFVYASKRGKRHNSEIKKRTCLRVEVMVILG